jgi:hypothetical protein
MFHVAGARVERLDGIMAQGRLDCADNRLFEPIGRLLSASVGRGGIATSAIQLKGGIDMVNRRMLLSLVLSTSMVLAGGIALAKNQHHSNGHNLLGAKLNQNGKHEIGKIGNNAVAAEVNNKKVVNMSAGNLPARKVKSNKKMAGVELGDLKMAANGDIQLAQVIDVSYGYCFDAGLDEYCYWYPASDVTVTDTWVVYVPL